MEIIVCVKQVPDGQAEVDPVTGLLKRGGAQGKLNPYDLFALELAFSLREAHGGSVRALSMGPPQAREALLETLYMGADSAVLLSDACFAGSDVAATSYVLGLGIGRMGRYDLILCGKQTTDGDTAQVGPELAERLGIEHAANVTGISGVDADAVTVRINMDDRVQTQRMRLPCLLTVEKDVNTPRLPSYLRMKRMHEDGLRIWPASELAVDPARCGADGSPTRVERIFPPVPNAEKRLLRGSGDELGQALGALLRERKLL